MQHEMHDYHLRVDGPLLARQRQLLLAIMDTVSRGEPYLPEDSSQKEFLQGLVALLDEIAD